MRRATLRLSRRDLARARALLDAGPAGGDPGPLDPGPVDLGSARDRNREFHFLLYERCGMPELTERIAAMWQAFPWDLMLDSEARAAASHREHLDRPAALETGDPDAVAAATERHLSNGFAAIRRQLTGGQGPDPFGLDVDEGHLAAGSCRWPADQWTRRSTRIDRARRRCRSPGPEGRRRVWASRGSAVSTTTSQAAP